jgi:hypothetical protein
LVGDEGLVVLLSLNLNLLGDIKTAFWVLPWRISKVSTEFQPAECFVWRFPGRYG